MGHYEPPVNHIAGTLLLLAARMPSCERVDDQERSRPGDALHLIRGIRVLVLVFVAGLSTLSFATGNMGLLVMGTLTLAEEIYETGRWPRSSALGTVRGPLIRVASRGDLSCPTAGQRVGSAGRILSGIRSIVPRMSG